MVEEGQNVDVLEVNVIEYMKLNDNLFLSKLSEIVELLSKNSRSLIYNLDSNIVEQFHSNITNRRKQ